MLDILVVFKYRIKDAILFPREEGKMHSSNNSQNIRVEEVIQKKKVLEIKGKD